MATMPLRACEWPGCREKTDRGAYCRFHYGKMQSTYRSGEDYKWRSSNRWHKYSKWYLGNHPLCVFCQREERVVPATDVDHIVRPKGDYNLFWSEDNHQALCHECHSSKTMKETLGH